MLRRGSIVWAVVPFQPEVPFRVWSGGEIEEVRSAPDLARRSGGLGRSRSVEVVAEAKLRPVVLLQDGPIGATGDVVALKLARLAKLPNARFDQIRAGEDPGFVPLRRRPAEYGLSTENAIDLNGVVRVHGSAFATSPIGFLDARELEQVDERLPGIWQFTVDRHAQLRVLDLWEAALRAHGAFAGEDPAR